MVNPKLRMATPDDARECGIIRYEAFKAIAEQHHFPPATPSPEFAAASFSRWISHPGYYVVVAELEGRIVGSNVLDERSAISGLGPITVDPTVQNRMVGSRLMQAALQRVSERRCPGVRLVQAAYHTRSLCLYTKLGFEVRELLVNLQGPPLALEVRGHLVRRAQREDLEGCNDLCRRVHGHDRSGELLDAITDGTATVVEHEERAHGLCDRGRVRRPCGGREQRRSPGADRWRLRIRPVRVSPAGAQRGVVPMVPRSRTPHGAAVHAYEHGPL